MVLKRIISYFCSFAIALSLLGDISFASAGFMDWLEDAKDNLYKRFSELGFEAPGLFIKWDDDGFSGGLTGWKANAIINQNYYTNPTESTEDEDGNVLNIYKDGATNNTHFMDIYNQDFTTIHNVTNTNNYEANIALENFLNSYTTQTNNYTYNTEYNSWYYDQTTNTINYDASNTYYNVDNSQYFITIDNSTDVYYLVNIQYSPTYVTVNYTYNNIDNSVHYGNVTNVYYYELSDGRNSATLSVDDVLGLDVEYDAQNFELITDDSFTLSLQHFDDDYSDSSSYAHTFYSENRSTTYVDSSTFGKAVKLASGSAAGVQIPGLSGYNGLTFDFRIYYDKISSFEVYLGDSRLFGAIPLDVVASANALYVDHGNTFELLSDFSAFELNSAYEPTAYPFFPSSSFDYKENSPLPGSFDDLDVDVVASKYGYADFSSYPVPSNSTVVDCWVAESRKLFKQPSDYLWTFRHEHYLKLDYSWNPKSYIAADFAYSSYANQWVSMRITISDGVIYYFVNGDLVGAGSFTMPSADKFYIKSSGTVYLDELRITTGDMVYSSVYVPATAPYDTNKVLALPSDLQEGIIYVRHSTPVTVWRVGGVRPSNPVKGFLYIPLYSDHSAGQSQIYDGNNWVNVDTYIYNGVTTKSTKSHVFTTVGDYEDVAVNPGNPSGPGSSQTCSHNWEFVKTVAPTIDSDNNVVSNGYDLYSCSKCGAEHKDYDSTGPPSSDSDDDSYIDIVPDDLASFFKWLAQNLGKLINAVVDGFTTLIESTFGVLIDSLITLVSSAVEKISKLVDLFGTFGNALVSLWSWLPPDIVVLISGAISIFLLLAVIRLFVK